MLIFCVPQVQQRVTDLIRVIDTLLMEMQTHGAHWTSFLDKLAVINVTHMQVNPPDAVSRCQQAAAPPAAVGQCQ